MCGKDDTKTAVYNLEECTERGLEPWYNRLLEENDRIENNLVGPEDKIK